MAATFDPDLVERVATVISDEARAKHNASVRAGFRQRYRGLTFWTPNINIFRDPRWGRGQETYGECPHLTARLGVAFCKGLQGKDPTYLKLVATPKHFPGFGAVDADPHFALASIDLDLEGLEARELIPFRGAFEVGAGMVMSGHVALPAVTGDRALPATVSRLVMHELLRVRLGFTGVSITDAMDMKAVAQGIGGVVDSIVALRAGVDLVVATPGRLLDHQRRRNVSLDGVRRLVLDEADHMLDLGFLPQMQEILDSVPRRRQTLMFSATFSAEIRKLAGQWNAPWPSTISTSIAAAALAE